MQDTTNNQVSRPAFQYFSRQRGLSRRDADDLLDFWANEGALTDPAAARQRIGEVVMFARAGDGAVAGVCTARECTLPQLRQPMYYYRSYIGARARPTAPAISVRSNFRICCSVTASSRRHRPGWRR